VIGPRSGCTRSTTRSGPGAGAVEAQGRGRPPGASELHQRAPAAPGLPAGLHPHIGRSASTRPAATTRTTGEASSRRWSTAR
jgi:hypothetical protein